MSSSNRHTMPPELQASLAEKPAAERERIALVWQLLGQMDNEALDVPDTDTALAELDQALTSSTPGLRNRIEDRPPAPRQRISTRRWIGASVACVLALFALGTWWQTPVVIEAVPGQQVIASLPDGSQVELNSGSQIRFSRRFESVPFIKEATRTIHLDGEAFFEVEPGQRPFIVSSFNADVRALGTAFNVRAFSDPPIKETLVTLSHGSIEVTANADATLKAILQEEGEALRIVDTNQQVQFDRPTEQRLDHVLAWRKKGFFVVDAPVPEAVREIERRFAITIQLEDSIDPSVLINLYLSEPATAEKIIEDICHMQSCNYRQTSSGFVIF